MNTREQKRLTERLKRGSLRLEADSLGRSNVNKRGPKSKDEGCIRTGKPSAQQLAFAALCREGMDPVQARVEAGLPPLR